MVVAKLDLTIHMDKLVGKVVGSILVTDGKTPRKLLVVCLLPLAGDVWKLEVEIPS